VQEVSKALWNRRQIQVDYRRGGARVAKSMILHPQGLVLDGEVLTLIAVANNYVEPYNFNLMRMTQAQMLPGDSRKLDAFNFKQHVAKEFSWPYGEPKKIEGWCDTYDGDEVQGNFAHIRENGGVSGHEKFNFRETLGKGYFGYCPPIATCPSGGSGPAAERPPQSRADPACNCCRQAAALAGGPLAAGADSIST